MQYTCLDLFIDKDDLMAVGLLLKKMGFCPCEISRVRGDLMEMGTVSLPLVDGPTGDPQFLVIKRVGKKVNPYG